MYMKRCVEERNEQGNTSELEGREKKRQREDDPIESENTGGASSSKDGTSTEEFDDQQAESAKNRCVPHSQDRREIKGKNTKKRIALTEVGASIV